MACLDANDVQSLVAGALDDAARLRAREHLDACDDCRELFAALGRSGAGVAARWSETSSDHDHGEPGTAQRDDLPGPAALPAGTRVGRYVVTGTLGAGGMGIVYAADDPQLGRRVSLKLLRAALPGPGSSEAARVRLHREARAMARLSHPNVVAVHDVGTWQGQVFVAMELVDGQNLRLWRGSAERSVNEILDVFLAAGRGLCAAHAAGMVHRDFKPDNVLVGRDGRVCVTDFGLARSVEDPWQAAALELAPTLAATEADPELTRPGAILGTPAYMAPEQHAGGNVDTRTDQFSFCVALYEALHGERPFSGRTIDDLAQAVAAGRVAAPPRGARVPARLRRILLRGLSPRPGDRWPTMELLLAALGRDRKRVPRRVAAIALAVAALSAVSLFGDWILRERLTASARLAFEAAGDQLVRSLDVRYDAFAVLSDLSYVSPVLRKVASNNDEADFGLGPEEADARRLTELHANLASADWSAWTRAARGGVIAVADYKGRLVYTSAAGSAFGMDARSLPAVDRAYSVDRPDGSAMVARGDDEVLLGSGIVGEKPRPGLVLVFARATMLGGTPRAVFIQTLAGSQLLRLVTPGKSTRLSLVARDGAAEGDVPVAVAAAGVTANRERLVTDADGDPWLVQGYPMRGLDDDASIATIVLARPMGAGLAGLFGRARTVLWALLLAAALISALALLAARSE